MNRFALLAIAVVSLPAIARAELPQELPKIPPLPETVSTPATIPVGPAIPTMSAVSVSPWPTNCAPTVAAPMLMSPLPVYPTVPVPAAVVACDTRPSFLKHMTNWFTGRASSCTSCDATCPTPQVQLTRLGSCTTAKRVHSGPSWDRLKAYFRWKPCQEQLLPIFVPTPYEAPISAYSRDCQEPTPGIPCATPGPKCATGGCPTSACTTQTAVGPVVSPFVYLNNVLKPKPMPAVTQASATVPVAAPQNPLVRPFTSP